MNNTNIKKLKNEIEKTIKERNLSFFIGAGVSKISNLPSWNELISEMSKIINLPTKIKYDNNDLLTIPQKFYFEIEKNDDKYYEFLNKYLSTDKLETNEIFDLIMLFKPKKIITTNFDDFIERTANKLLLPYKVISKDSDISSIDMNPFILKVHGDLKNRNIVLKEDDYLNYEKNFNLINTLLKTIFATDTVVFIGYSLNDYNIKLIINWAQNALGDKFIQPYFIYTDSDKLLKTDLRYFESRKIKLIDSNIFVNKKSTYIDRYKFSLDFLLNIKESKEYLQNETSSFEFLFEKFQILNQLNSIRTRDIVSFLSPYVESDSPYVIRSTKNYNLFEKYFILKTKQSEVKITRSDKNKLDTIDSVLSKASILYYYNNDKYIPFKVIPKKIGIEFLIYNDFNQMNNFVLNEYENLNDNFKKAYYLAKLKNYEKSLELYEKIADESYKNQDFLTLFLTQINRSNIYTIGYYYIDKNKYNTQYFKSFFTKNRDCIFENLPINAQSKLSFLSEYGKLKSIYRNVYNAISIANKYKEDLNVGVKFLGGNGIDKQIKLFHESIDFSQSNYILDDEFSEYTDLIRSSMTSILSKVSHQNLDYNLFVDSDDIFNINEATIELDEVDFYCLQTYFKDKELSKLFKEFELEYLIFDLEMVRKTTLNFLYAFYNQRFQELNKNWKFFYLPKLNSLLTLLKYIKLDINLLNDILDVLLCENLNIVDISLIYNLLGSQRNHGLMFNSRTNKLILGSLEECLKLELISLRNGDVVELRSVSNIYYYDLIDFIPNGLSKKQYVKINSIIIEILNFDIIEIYKRLMNFKKLLDNGSIKKINKHIEIVLLCNFEEELFIHYIIFNRSLSIKIKKVFEDYVKDYILNEEKKEIPNGIYPKYRKYNWIIRVAKFSFIEDIELSDFNNLLGFDNELDFFINPFVFDYSKFDIYWIISIGSVGLKRFSNDQNLRIELKMKFREYLDIKTLSIADRSFITKLYFKYFD